MADVPLRILGLDVGTQGLRLCVFDEHDGSLTRHVETLSHGKDKLFTEDAVLLDKLEVLSAHFRVRECCVSVPASYNSAQRRKIAAVVAKAGLSLIAFTSDTCASFLALLHLSPHMLEPHRSSLSRSSSGSPSPRKKSSPQKSEGTPSSTSAAASDVPPEHYIVMDIGASYNQCALIAYCAQTACIEQIGYVADTQCTGTEFDRRVIQYIASRQSIKGLDLSCCAESLQSQRAQLFPVEAAIPPIPSTPNSTKEATPASSVQNTPRGTSSEDSAKNANGSGTPRRSSTSSSSNAASGSQNQNQAQPQTPSAAPAQSSGTANNSNSSTSASATPTQTPRSSRKSMMMSPTPGNTPTSKPKQGANIQYTLPDGTSGSVLVTPLQYTNANLDLYKAAVNPVRHMLREQHPDIPLASIKRVFVTGGCAQNAKLQQAIVAFFDQEHVPVLFSTDPVNAAQVRDWPLQAVGAALVGSLRAGVNYRPINHWMVLEDSYMLLNAVFVGQHKTVAVIDRAVCLPYETELELSTSMDQQSQMEVMFMQGSRPNAMDSVLKLTVSGIPKMGPGAFKLTCMVVVDENGCVSAKVTEVPSGVSVQVEEL
jgi:hypothetical protein